MDRDRMPKQALKYRPKGKRSIGRPRKNGRTSFISGIKNRHLA
jgi:hypothetical protein